MRQALDPATLADQVVAGSRAHVARALTLVESNKPDHRTRARELLSLLRPHTGEAVRVGISGVPGAGKSTFINAMGTRLIERGHRVAVLAVDPSSSRSGGSVLGDRTRMADLAMTDNAFIRPSPSGNHLGGVARATREGMLVMEAAGYDTIIVETVGVGQSEVAVAGMVDTFLLLMIARTGDQLQGIKRGILEMADVIAVNKADGDGLMEARVAARELTIAMRLIKPEGERRTPVLTSSSYTGDGLDEVWQAVLDHRARLASGGHLDERRAAQQQDWMWSLVRDELSTALLRSSSVKKVRKALEQRVGAGELSALEASQEILSAFTHDLAESGWQL